MDDLPPAEIEQQFAAGARIAASGESRKPWPEPLPVSGYARLWWRFGMG
jgi:hypothetical protein